MEIVFAAKIIRQIRDLESALQEEVYEKIDLFRDAGNHKQLKVHKLHGRMRGYYSFSVNYKFRIVFKYINKKTIILLTVGDHEIYS